MDKSITPTIATIFNRSVRLPTEDNMMCVIKPLREPHCLIFLTRFHAPNLCRRSKRAANVEGVYRLKVNRYYEESQAGNIIEPGEITGFEMLDGENTKTDFCYDEIKIIIDPALKYPHSKTCDLPSYSQLTFINRLQPGQE